ncbi:MAG TPA: nucleotidyltransferase domain-containing protein [Clostridiales bacterium]|nr:nucleotidyltransferase domain-containing protein [Clostridiales bacterium]
MTKQKVQKVISEYILEAKRQFGTSLKAVILFGSCARGDFDKESDIDLLVLLAIHPEKLSEARNTMRPTADKLDLKYDVVISAVFQNYDIFKEYKEASGFYKNIEKEGVIVG